MSIQPLKSCCSPGTLRKSQSIASSAVSSSQLCFEFSQIGVQKESCSECSFPLPHLWLISLPLYHGHTHNSVSKYLLSINYTPERLVRDKDFLKLQSLFSKNPVAWEQLADKWFDENRVAASLFRAGHGTPGSKTNITSNSAMEEAAQKWQKWPVLTDLEEFARQTEEKEYFRQTEPHEETATSDGVGSYSMG